jgi:release factor glutamine methyltransferase
VIETVLELVQATPASVPLRLVDVGTGSGCIALALAAEMPLAEIHATDISPEALEVARANAARHQLAARVQFRCTDLLHGVDDVFDFVVSNPPYVGDAEEDKVQLEVRKFEPRCAVFAGPTGREIFERLIPQARAVLRLGGWLVLEIGYTQSPLLRQLLADWKEVRFTNDLQGIPRVVAARN